MKPNDMPLVCLPLGLCDDDAATLPQFFYDLTEALERHYAWSKKAIINVACTGRFSSDRTIREYADEIWSLKESPVS